MYAFDVDRSSDEMSKNLVTLLVKRGANPNESFDNMTAWEYALTVIAPQRFRFGWDKIFEVMLKYHADANQKVHKGDTFTTAFHLVVELIGYNCRVIPSRYLDRHPSSNMIKLFLEHGGNPQATDSSGLTVLDAAKNAFPASSPVLRDLIGKSKSLKRPRPSSSSTNHAE
jgi:ankyrin repeat protein